ncbi:Grasp-with-spasm system ATP-grasp peptide maturase [Flavobacterium sp. 9AF]|uniref:hypothetical protein n=1 Tax=Flavobacterium sp. 9AF TaxID=2653142 RepID=UPI0012F2F997|nr:hypothetical protein [Flavobacterium sp. 9AF]VXB10445.1 Grasp-with-spasm system ATP-grasp peptide maturase [Flavobacterium sp. 9AF]
MELNFSGDFGTVDNKKIIIQSESKDRSTDDVIQWIRYLSINTKIEEIFDFLDLQEIKIEIANDKFNFRLNNLDYNYNDSYWYRRGIINIPNTNGFIQESIENNNSKPILDFLNSKSNKIQINKFQDNYLGKLKQLEVCKLIELNFPETLITTNFSDLQKFVELHNLVITKPIENPFSNHIINNKDVCFFTPSQLITNEILNKITTKRFEPSLFQKYIEKKFEIRSFYINGIFKSMAIFSQQNEKTKIDYRDYDRERPNRVVPFNLPTEIENKLTLLMKKLNLNCGSFDLIYTLDNQYVFLEVNPIGQFQWVSRNCNHYIEKLIAKTLINEE